jgi:hypothetical protein
MESWALINNLLTRIWPYILRLKKSLINKSFPLGSVAIHAFFFVIAFTVYTFTFYLGGRSTQNLNILPSQHYTYLYWNIHFSYFIYHSNFVLDPVLVTNSNTCARECRIFRKVKLYWQIRWIYCQYISFYCKKHHPILHPWQNNIQNWKRYNYTKNNLSSRW